MKKLGRVLQVSKVTGNLLVKSDFEPKIGTRVFDKEPKHVGIVFDIFGPISSPYVSIKPTTGNHEKLVSQTLFLLEEKMRKKK